MSSAALEKPPKAKRFETKKSRRKHKNSKLGCFQCKERRMKCNETLPECRNCVIRQEKIPCSYLSFTPEQKEDFTNKKLLEEEAAKYSHGTSTGCITPSYSSLSDTTSPGGGVTVNLVRHTRLPYLKSQNMPFFGEEPSAVQSRLYFIGLINRSLYADPDAFSAHLTLASHWVHLQLSKKAKALSKGHKITAEEANVRALELEQLSKIAIRSKLKALQILSSSVAKIIEAQKSQDYRTALSTFGKISASTICLQSADILTESSLRFYYINGSVSILNELHSSIQDSSPVVQFIAQSVLVLNRCLFIPNYSSDVFHEFYDTVNELKDFVSDTQDLLLIDQFEDLVDFMKHSLMESSIESFYNPSSVTSYPPTFLYQIFHRFYQIIPSQAMTIVLSDSPIHKLVYSIYYSLARVLDNVFPEVRYLAQYRFIGPTNIYPYDPVELVDSLPDDLKIYGLYFTRILAFFSRRADFFIKYMEISTPFPENLSENRFASRKVKVNETFINNFKTTKITKIHFPQVINRGEGDSNESPASDASFSHNFHASFSLGLQDITNFRKYSPDGINANVLQDYKLLGSGLLECDYDPYLEDWTENTKVKSGISVDKFTGDRAVLMKKFIKNE